MGSRVARYDFFPAAYGLLAERGGEGLTVAALCDRLAVSKGSFYHHFGDLPAFVAEFVEDWRTWMVGRFEELSGGSDLRRRLEVVNWAFAMTAPGAQAVRAWAYTDVAVARALTDVQEVVNRRCVDIWGHATEDHDSGYVLAAVGNAMGAGVQLRPRPLTRVHFLRLISILYRSVGARTDLVSVAGRPYLRVVSCERTARVAADVDEGIAWRAGESTDEPREPGTGMRAEFFGAAWSLLGEHGPGGLTIVGLGERLHLSKGSFQHHFGSMPRFVELLAADWAEREADRIAGCLRERTPRRRMEALHSNLLLAPTAAEAAWRAWSHTNPTVGDAVRHVDARREAALSETLARLSSRPDTNLLAELTFGAALGLHQWQPAFDAVLRARVVVEWMRRVLGLDAHLHAGPTGPQLRFA